MSRVQRGRAQAYDNISAGNVISSQERTINGSLPPAEMTGKWLDNLAVGSPPPTANTPDDIQAGVVMVTIENVKAGG